jgi:peptidoglycan/LPS O-acetylase OafA/YrhL
MRPLFFQPAVGLRAYLATWVVLGHGLQLAGYVKSKNPLVAFLLRGDAAVSVFIILSGFVITNLLLSKQETYGQYIVRRFFRLFPVYAVCSVVGFFVVPAWVRYVELVPWHDASWWSDYSALIHELASEVRVHFWRHLGLHAVMLHGVVPSEVLPRAAVTFLPAAWSISLEWQFYLVAPFVVACLGSWVRTTALLCLCGGVYTLASKGYLGTYTSSSTILLAVHYFAIGIGSRLAYEPLRTLAISPVVLAALVSMGAIVMARDPLPILVWGAFFSYLALDARAPRSGALFRKLTTNRWATELGDASYSLYLIHRPIQVVLAYLAAQSFAITRGAVFATQLVALVAAAGISLLSYRYIEKVGQQWGSRLAELLVRRGAAEPELAR